MLLTPSPIHLRSHHTAEWIEGIATEVTPLPFVIDSIECDGRYQAGDNVVLTSSDGATFLGHLSDVEEDRLRIHVELD